MRNFNPFTLALLTLVIFLPGCGLIKGVFQAGFWTAIILIILFIALVVWLISKFTSSNRGRPPG